MSATALRPVPSAVLPAFRLESMQADFAAQFDALLTAQRESAADVRAVVQAILADLRARGDAALAEYTLRFDRVDFSQTPMRVSAEEIASAHARCETQDLEALAFAAARIRAFHEKQKPQDVSFEDALGVRLGWRWGALDSVGLYVPGGTASYPSSVLMNAIPAKVAGVARLVMVVPMPGGVCSPLVLAAAHLAGVDEVYRLGGAQAIGALAYGTKTLAPVAKIVGPGNAYVAEAKRQVFGQVGIDLVAGPSEVVIIADSSANPAWIAADLLAQAEHDEAAQSVLLTPDAALARAVETALGGQLAKLPRQAIAQKSWQNNGAIVVVQDLAEACALANRLAPEHLELMTENPETLAAQIRHAGAIFLGHYTPEAIGDYVGGSNHVLPTARSARFASGLGVLDFMKKTSLLACGPAQLAALGPHAIRLGHAEGLAAHAHSVAVRLTGGTL